MRFDLPMEPRWALAIVRLMMGVILVVAGAGKWAAGIGGFVGFLTQLGIPAPQVVAPIIASGELLGGMLLLLGLGARPVAVWFICEFVVTSFYVKLPRTGFDSGRIDLMMLAGSVMLVLAGAGALALDDWVAQRRTTPQAHTAMR